MVETASTGPPFTGTVTVVFVTSVSFPCHRKGQNRQCVSSITYMFKTVSFITTRHENCLYVITIKEKVKKRLKLQPYHLWSSASRSWPLGGERRTIDELSGGALKPEKQAWDSCFQATRSSDRRGKHTWAFHTRFSRFLSRTILTLVESQSCRTSEGLNISDAVSLCVQF